jgi:hypothetical protein
MALIVKANKVFTCKEESTKNEKNVHFIVDHTSQSPRIGPKLVFVALGCHCMHDMVLGSVKWPRFTGNQIFLVAIQ